MKRIVHLPILINQSSTANSDKLVWWGALCMAILLMALHATPSWAASVVEVNSGFRDKALGTHIQYLIDPQRNMSLADVRNRAEDFIPSTVEILNPGYTDDGYWVRFQLHNSSQEDVSLFLQFRSLFVDHLNLYVPAPEGDYKKVASGRMVKPTERPMQDRQFVFPITVPANSEQTYYIYCDSADTLTIPLYLLSQEALQEHRVSSYRLLAFYQGLIFAVIAFSLFLMATVRDRVYFYYICAIVLHHGIFFSLFDGLAYVYFSFEDSWWFREAQSVFVCLSMWAILRFARVMLNTQEHQPRLDRMIVWLVYAAFGAAVLSIFLDYYISIRITNPIASLTGVLVWVVAWNSLVQGNSAARYFLFAWTSVIVGGLAYSLKSWGLVPSNFFTEHAWQAGSAIEALLLSMAIAERINIEVRQREQMQQEVQKSQQHALEVQRQANESLERRVRERTLALEEANRQLQEISDTDQLTGVKNRRYLDNYIKQEFSRAVRTQQEIALVLIDVDHFKSVNDTHGHLVGDDCLLQLASIASTALTRPTDLLARYGGEEFCLVLPNTHKEGASVVAERLRALVESRPISTRIGPLPITVSVGVYGGIPEKIEDSRDFLKFADEALYRSKEQGRNRVTMA